MVDFKVRLRFDTQGAVDMAGNTWRNDGVSLANGRFGATKCGYFAGTYTRLQSSVSLDLRQDFTICFFNKRSTTDLYSVVISDGGVGNSVQLDDAHGSCCLTIRLSGIIINATAAPTYTDNNWHHYAITRQAGNLYFFVDGELCDTKYHNGVLSSGTTCIGYWDRGSGARECLDDICIIDGQALWTGNFTPPSGYLLNDQITYLKDNKVWGMNNGILTKLSDNYSVLTDTEKESLFITTNYETASAADLSSLGKFRALIYSTENSNRSCAIVAVPTDQFILPKGLINIDSFEGIERTELSTSLSANAKCKLLITTDLKTYQTYDFQLQQWKDVDHTNLIEVENQGIDAAQLSNIPRTAWAAFTKGKAGIGFAYLLSMEDTTDTCNIDKLELLVDMIGEWSKTDIK